MNISRSHIVPTAVQALIDAQSVIQKWADKSVEVSPFLLQISDLPMLTSAHLSRLVPFRYYPLSLDPSCTTCEQKKRNRGTRKCHALRWPSPTST